MPSRIIISPRAQADYFKIANDIKEKWSLKEVSKFDQQFNIAIIQIGLNPLAFNRYKNKNIRRYVIDKHNVVFYRLKKDIVEIITIWASKRSPRKLKL